MNRTSISNQKSLIPSSKRIKGLSAIKRNDVLVFNDPSDYTKYMVKRCVAIPKDSIAIKKSIVYINNKEMVDARYVKKEHEIKYLDTNYPFPELMRDLGIRHHESWIERKNILEKVSLTVEKKTELLEIIDSNQVSEVHEYSDPELVIYKKFKTTDYPKYSKVFNKYENCTFNSTSESELIFNNDYYFVLGDKRNDFKIVKKSCLTQWVESNKDRITRLVKEWDGKEIVFPENMVFPRYEVDTLDFRLPQSDYTIVSYIDSVDFPKQPIAAGKEALIKVTYKAGKPEYVNKVLMVYANIESAIRLTIKGSAN